MFQVYRPYPSQKTRNDKQDICSLFHIITVFERLTMDCFDLNRDLRKSLRAIKEDNQTSHYKNGLCEFFSSALSNDLKKEEASYGFKKTMV